MRASRGFTLIELMVVMVIISVLIGLAVLSTGFASTSRELDSEAERLAGLIGVLTDEAVLDNREYGLRLERDAYQLSLIHISEPTRQAEISYAVFCLKKKKNM